MKRIFTGIVLIAMMILGACGGKKADDPITKIELGMTLEQAMEAEPELTVYEGKGYSCSKSYADAEGTMLISLSPFDGDDSVFTVLWQLDPTDGNGKSVYDKLFSDLKNAYGKPRISNDNTDVESVTGIHDEAQALWKFKDYTVSCSYIEYPESGKCQIQYKRGKTTDNLKF